jgi:type I restriction enzyme M protein
MLPMTVLRRFDCVLEETKPQVLARFKQNESKGEKKLEGDALDRILNNAGLSLCFKNIQ